MAEKKMKRRRPLTEPKEFVVAFINEYNAATSAFARVVLLNNLHNLYSASTLEKFVEFNGAFIAGDWIGKAAQSRESDTLEALLRILSILPCTIKLLQRSQLVSLLERLESEPWLPVVVKGKISAILADWNSSQEFQKGWLLYSASMTQNTTRSSKKKSSGPVSWVEDSKVVQVKEFSGEESDRSSDANDIVDTGLRHSSVSSILIDWHMPEDSKIEDVDVELWEELERKESNRTSSVMEALYYHRSMAPPDPLGPPLYSIDSTPKMKVEFGPIDVEIRMPIPSRHIQIPHSFENSEQVRSTPISAPPTNPSLPQHSDFASGFPPRGEPQTRNPPPVPVRNNILPNQPRMFYPPSNSNPIGQTPMPMRFHHSAQAFPLHHQYPLPNPIARQNPYGFQSRIPHPNLQAHGSPYPIPIRNIPPAPVRGTVAGAVGNDQHICKFYLSGLCRKGSACPLIHQDNPQGNQRSRPFFPQASNPNFRGGPALAPPMRRNPNTGFPNQY